MRVTEPTTDLPTAGPAETSAPPPLPTALPSAWSVRRPVASDATAVLALCAAVDTAVLGHPDVSLEDVRADLASTAADARRNQLVVLDGDRVLAWVWVEDRAEGRTLVDLFVDRTLLPAQRDPLADWAWTWMIARGREIGRERGIDTTLLDTGLPDADAWGADALSRQGFEPVRTWWRMSRDVGPDHVWSPAPGVVVRPLDRSRLDEEVATVHRILEAAFADHWNHHAVPFDPWWRARQEAPGFDLDLWWLAELHGEPSGALIGSTQAGDEGALHVVSLGTLRQARGNGVAHSLLGRAFAEVPARGWTRAMLNVDGENPTGATALYRSVGMVVEFAMSVWHRTVSTAAP